MSTSTVVEAGSITTPVAKVRKDLKTSLAILYAGIGLTIVWGGLLLSQVALRGFDSSPGLFVALSAIPSVGSTCIVVGAIFAAINWSMLRRGHPPAPRRE